MNLKLTLDEGEVSILQIAINTALEHVVVKIAQAKDDDARRNFEWIQSQLTALNRRINSEMWS